MPWVMEHLESLGNGLLVASLEELRAFLASRGSYIVEGLGLHPLLVNTQQQQQQQQQHQAHSSNTSSSSRATTRAAAEG